MGKTVKDFRYHVYADYGKGMELAAGTTIRRKQTRKLGSSGARAIRQKSVRTRRANHGSRRPQAVGARRV